MIKYNLPQNLNHNTLESLPLPVLPYERLKLNISVNGVNVNVFKYINELESFLDGMPFKLSDFSIRMYNGLLFMLYVGPPSDDFDFFGLSLD